MPSASTWITEGNPEPDDLICELCSQPFSDSEGDPWAAPTLSVVRMLLTGHTKGPLISRRHREIGVPYPRFL